MNNIYNKAKQEYETGTITIKALAKYIIYKNRIMPSQDESLKMISAELSGELLDNIYEPNGSILC